MKIRVPRWLFKWISKRMGHMPNRTKLLGRSQTYREILIPILPNLRLRICIGLLEHDEDTMKGQKE